MENILLILVTTVSAIFLLWTIKVFIVDIYLTVQMRNMFGGMVKESDFKHVLAANISQKLYGEVIVSEDTQSKSTRKKNYQES